MIQIEDGVSLPDLAAPRSGAKVYPFAAMKIGQSFVLPWAMAARLGSAAKIWKRRHPGWNYVTRVSGDEIRLWRVE